MQDRHSTEDTAAGDMEVQTVSVGKENKTPQLVLMDKEADVPPCIPVRVSSGEHLRNTPGLMRG